MNCPNLLVLAGVLAIFPSQALFAEAIPDGEIASNDGPGIVEAFIGCPTDRYPHGVLGDRIEGGCLVVTDDTGVKHTRILPDDHVFEDLTPQIADVDGDGRSDVTVVLTSMTAGASFAIYSIKDEKLSLLAATPYIGEPYRWLAPAGITDFNGDGKNDIAYVQTPHIEGTLKIWTMNEGELTMLGSAAGVTNHKIGSRQISFSKILDHNKDGLDDLALMNDEKTRIWIFSIQEEDLVKIADIPADQSFFD